MVLKHLSMVFVGICFMYFSGIIGSAGKCILPNRAGEEKASHTQPKPPGKCEWSEMV